MSNWKTPALVSIRPEWAQTIPFGKRNLADSGDALLYLSALTKAQPAWDQLDSTYFKELDRRSRIEWGCGFSLERWKSELRPCP
jgi:hypothetical protein